MITQANPRPHAGGDGPRRTSASHFSCVSIRAPTRGAIFRPCSVPSWDAVSIRAPTRGAMASVRYPTLNAPKIRKNHLFYSLKRASSPPAKQPQNAPKMPVVGVTDTRWCVTLFCSLMLGGWVTRLRAQNARCGREDAACEALGRGEEVVVCGVWFVGRGRKRAACSACGGSPLAA